MTRSRVKKRETPPLIEKTPEEKLIEFIQNERFNDAHALYKQGKVNSGELERAISKVQFNRAETIFFSFALFFAQREKTVMANKFVVSLLITDNVDLPGSYFLAYEYHKKVLREKTEDVDELNFALFFYDVPDEVVLLPEAKQIARKLRGKGIKSDEIVEILDGRN